MAELCTNKDVSEFILEVGLICPLVLIDPAYSGGTIVAVWALCLTTFNLSLTQNTCLFTDGNKACV